MWLQHQITAAHKSLMLFVRSVSVHKTSNLTGGTVCVILIRQIGHDCPQLSKNVSGLVDAPQRLKQM